MDIKSWVNPLVLLTPPPLEIEMGPPTPLNPPSLEDLSVSIHPKYAEANPGDTINYTVTIDWYPPEWRGDMKI